VTAKRTILILGAASGIARALARTLALEGHALILAGRDEDDLRRSVQDLETRFGGSYHACGFDATDWPSHDGFVKRCDELAGHALDDVVIAYGAMARQNEAAADPDLARQMIDVNLVSVICLGNRFADLLQARGKGTIAILSSVAGDRGRQSNFIYGAAKAGVSAYCQGLRNRLARHGVHVLTIKPGFVDTPMTQGLLNPRSPLVASPERVARDIAQAIRRRSNTLYTPWFWRYIMLVIRLVPESIFKRLRL